MNGNQSSDDIVGPRGPSSCDLLLSSGLLVVEKRPSCWDSDIPRGELEHKTPHWTVRGKLLSQPLPRPRALFVHQISSGPQGGCHSAVPISPGQRTVTVSLRELQYWVHGRVELSMILVWFEDLKKKTTIITASHHTEFCIFFLFLLDYFSPSKQHYYI